jgi:hypothetical protein
MLISTNIVLDIENSDNSTHAMRVCVKTLTHKV